VKGLLSQLAIGVMALAVAGGALAGTVTGVVRNGTTGAPAAGVEVVLIQLQGGMEAVANTKTDAQGHYRFEHSVIGRQPMLIRVNYRGVNFHQSLPPGRDAVDVEVFEPTADASVVQVASRLIAVQPNGSVLLVGEEYTVQNHSSRRVESSRRCRPGARRECPSCKEPSTAATTGTLWRSRSGREKAESGSPTTFHTIPIVPCSTCPPRMQPGASWSLLRRPSRYRARDSCPPAPSRAGASMHATLSRPALLSI
jgi:Carboxypeptidase regulatory-like domain